MNFMNRAWLYIIRKKGKSALLFIILLIISTFVLTALALGNASDAARHNLQKDLGGSFIVGFDYSENNPYLKVEQIENGTITYPTRQISPELVEKIRKINGVNNCSATVENLASVPELKLFIGNIPIEEDFRQFTKILGVWKSEELSHITAGQIELTQGRHITPEDKNKGIISKDLAEKNGLKIGDTIHMQKGVDIEIVGLFNPGEIESIGEQVTTYDKIQNFIISDLSTVVELEGGPAVQGFSEVIVSVDEPQNMDNIIAKVKDIKNVDWRGFSISFENESYENVAVSLGQMSSLVSTILLVVLIVSVVILSLILTMWARTRIHETGILLSVGIHKLSILGQYIAEVLMIAVVAFLLSYFSSSAIANQMGRLLQSEQGAVMGQSETEGMSEGGREGAALDAESQEVKIPRLQVTVELKEMGLLFLIGITIVTISAGISSISTMLLKPREILTKMS